MLSSRLYCVNGLTFTQRVLNTKYECAQFSGSYFSENAVVKLFLTPIVYNVCVQTKHLCNVSIILLAALFFNPFRPVIKNKCTVWRRQSLFQGGGGLKYVWLCHSPFHGLFWSSQLAQKYVKFLLVCSPY